MEMIKTSQNLKSRIQELEIQQLNDLTELKKQLFYTYENLKPLNLIKNSLKEAVTSPDLKQNIMGAAVGLASGYLSKAVIVGASHNPIKKVAGSVVQLLISNSIAQHPETVNKLATGLLKLLGKKKEAIEEKI